VLKTIRHYRRELWTMIFLKILLSYSYFCLSSRLVVYLSEDHGFTDIEAADLYGVWGVSMSLIQFAAGPVIDRLQIRRSIILGSLINTVGMFMLAATFNMNWLLVVALVVVMPVGAALGLAVVDIGGKRYSPDGNGSMYLSLALLYSASNFGASMTGATVEFLQDKFGEEGVQYGKYHATADRILILVAAIATAIAGLIAALIVNDEVQTQRQLEMSNVTLAGTVPTTGGRVHHVNEDDDNDAERAEPVGADRTRWFWRCRVAWLWITTDVIPVLRNSYFQRLFLMSAVTIGVKLVYRSIDATFPKVIMRTFGADSHVGALYSINPTMIIFIVPPIAAFITRFDIYNVIIVGTLISACSMFIMAGELTLLTVILWSVVFTIGEAIYSNTLGVYFMAIAPDGREGLYTSLAYAPNLLAKVIVGPMSGSLLATYCPKEGPFDECRKVFLNVGLYALSTPALLLLFYRVIHNDSMRVRVRERLNDQGLATD